MEDDEEIEEDEDDSLLHEDEEILLEHSDEDDELNDESNCTLTCTQPRLVRLVPYRCQVAARHAD